VNGLYEQYLHRSALVDPNGLQFWTAALASGSTVEQVAAMLVNSSEYVSNQTDGTFNSWLVAFYRDALHRAVDDGGRAAWDQAFMAGQSRGQIALDIFTLPPLVGKAGNEYQLDLVDGYYEQLLGRPAAGDPGADYWLGLLQTGARNDDVIAGIMASNEYYDG
jgi:hypothetical protein